MNAGWLICLVAVLVAEVTALSVLVDNDTLPRTGHLLPLLRDGGAAAVRGAVAFGAVFLPSPLSAAAHSNGWYSPLFSLRGSSGILFSPSDPLGLDATLFRPPAGFQSGPVGRGMGPDRTGHQPAAFAFLSTKTWRRIVEATGSLLGGRAFHGGGRFLLHTARARSVGAGHAAYVHDGQVHAVLDDPRNDHGCRASPHSCSRIW